MLRRPSRALSAVVSGLLTVTAIFAGGVITAAPAYAAAGDPFPAADPYVFVAQNNPTGLFKATTDATGKVTFQAEGPTSPLVYNAIGYNTANNYLYGLSTGMGTSSIPQGSLVRIGQQGAVTRVGTATYGTSLIGSFGPNGHYYIVQGSPNVLKAINVTTGTVVSQVTLSDTLGSLAYGGGADFAFKDNYFWSLGQGQLVRVHPTTGVMTRWSVSSLGIGTSDAAGAAWTFGNGNLGFSYNSSGTVYQIAVTNPAAANPGFQLVSQTTGPGSSNNDGAASPGQPTDFTITKTAPAIYLPGDTLSYTLTVTNSGPGNASGYTVTDVVPATLTNVTTSTPGCTVTGNTVMCVGGRTLANGSATITINATAPASAAACITNTATVTANESDPTPGNNTATATSCEASLALVKQAAPPADANGDGIVDAGDTVAYSFTVTNTGNVPLDGIAVSDPKIGSVTCPQSTLAAKSFQICTADAPYTITTADEATGGVDNTATASGTAPGSRVITSAPSSTHTPTMAPAPGLSITKSASPSDPASFVLGQIVTYSFVLKNTGNVPISNVVIDESDFSGTGALPALDCPAGADTLQAGEQVTCTTLYTLTQQDVDAGEVSNSATATGVPPEGPEIITPPSRFLIPIDAAPGITLVKSANPTTAAKAGDSISYTFLVTNSGNVSLSDPSIAETAFSGTGTHPVPSCPSGAMIPGQSMSCTASYTLTQADVDAGTVTNTATATATPASAPAPTSAPSSAAVSIAPAAALTAVKTATPSTVNAIGDTVIFSFLVTNTGNVTISNVTVDEGDFSGSGTLGVISCPAGAASLAPQDSVTCTASYTLTQADMDVGTVTNSATATGTPPAGGTPPVSPPTSTTVTVDRAPALALVKTATPTAVSAVGDTVAYTFLVTNTGNVTLSDPRIAEEAFTGSGTAPTVVCPTGDFAPGADMSCNASYSVTQADIDAGTITNTAVAAATPPAGLAAPASDPSSATVTASAAPALTVAKSASPGTVTQAGQTVSYSFLVTNTGNVTLGDISIVEGTFTGTGTLSTPVCPQASLAPGTDETCTASYTVTQADVDSGLLENSATATGTPPGSNTPVSSIPSTSTVTLDRTPAMTVVKSASPNAPADFRVDEEITYSFVVTNTGNVTISGVTVDEASFTGTGTLAAPSCPAGAASLAPGAQVICTTVYTVTQPDIDAGSITNSATTTGTPPTGTVPPISPPSTVVVPAPPLPAATVVKTADTTAITRAGQQVTYLFTVTNTGNTTLTSPTINEGAFTGHGTLSEPVCPAGTPSLAPGQIVVCQAVYTVVAADLSGRPLANTATVTATPPGGPPIQSDPSTVSVPDHSPLPITGSPIDGVLGALGALAVTLVAVGGVFLFLRRRRALT